MTCKELFDRAAAYEVTEREIADALSRVRDE